VKTSYKLITGVFGLAISAMPSAAWAAGSVVGTWRLVSYIEEETESKAVHKNFGDHPSGLITYTSDGRMMVIFTDPNRKPPAAAQATDLEAAQLYRTMVAYAGTYKTEGDKVIHYPEVSWSQAPNGRELTRFFEVEDDRLQLKSPPVVSPLIGKEIVGTVVWERVK
jgi:hypothetical protein